LFSAQGTIDGVDQRLDFQEFVARPFRFVAVERRGQNLGVAVSVLDHALTGLFQSFKTLVHLDSFAADEGRAPDHAGSASHSAQRIRRSSLPTLIKTKAVSSRPVFEPTKTAGSPYAFLIVAVFAILVLLPSITQFGCAMKAETAIAEK
jgi:hypothetical protein